MARHGSHRRCIVDGWLAEKVQTQLGILAVPVEQRALGRVGMAGPRLRIGRSSTLPRVHKHPRRLEESNLLTLASLVSNPRTFALTVTYATLCPF